MVTVPTYSDIRHICKVLDVEINVPLVKRKDKLETLEFHSTDPVQNWTERIAQYMIKEHENRRSVIIQIRYHPMPAQR